MAYNLRSRNIRQQLLVDDNAASRVEADDALSDDEPSHTSDESEDDSEIDATSDLEDDQNETINQRHENAAARGRPRAKLKGKDGFTWDTRVPSRRSGILKNVQYVYKFLYVHEIVYCSKLHI